MNSQRQNKTKQNNNKNGTRFPLLSLLCKSSTELTYKELIDTVLVARKYRVQENMRMEKCVNTSTSEDRFRLLTFTNYISTSGWTTQGYKELVWREKQVEILGILGVWD